MIETTAITAKKEMEEEEITLGMGPDQMSNTMIETASIAVTKEMEARTMALDAEVLTGASTLPSQAPRIDQTKPNLSSPPKSPHSQSLRARHEPLLSHHPFRHPLPNTRTTQTAPRPLDRHLQVLLSENRAWQARPRHDARRVQLCKSNPRRPTLLLFHPQTPKMGSPSPRQRHSLPPKPIPRPRLTIPKHRPLRHHPRLPTPEILLPQRHIRIPRPNAQRPPTANQPQDSNMGRVLQHQLPPFPRSGKRHPRPTHTRNAHPRRRYHIRCNPAPPASARNMA